MILTIFIYATAYTLKLHNLQSENYNMLFTIKCELVLCNKDLYQTDLSSAS